MPASPPKPSRRRPTIQPLQTDRVVPPVIDSTWIVYPHISLQRGYDVIWDNLAAVNYREHTAGPARRLMAASCPVLPDEKGLSPPPEARRRAAMVARVPDMLRIVRDLLAATQSQNAEAWARCLAAANKLASDLPEVLPTQPKP